MTYLHDHISTVSGALNYKDSLHYKKFQLRHEQSNRPELQAANNAAAQPNYVFLMTEPNNLLLFLAALTPESLKASYNHYALPPVPSSTLFFEVSENSNGEMEVSAHFNDEEIPLGGCSENKACALNSFVQWIESSVKVTDVVAACKAQSKKTETFVQ